MSDFSLFYPCMLMDPSSNPIKKCSTFTITKTHFEHNYQLGNFPQYVGPKCNKNTIKMHLKYTTSQLIVSNA